MSKAIQGAVEIGVVAGIAAFAMATTGGAASVVLPLLLHEAGGVLGVVLATGVSNEIGALASALSQGNGDVVTTRQPAANRRIIYGTRRVGGDLVYVSTTGSKNDQYNMVIVLATHVCEAIENLYLDGRQVYWAGQGADYTVRSGVGFGGGADGQNHTGPNGVQYNFANASSGHAGLYAVGYFGDQAPGTVCGSLQANDGNWKGTGGQTPYLGGCTYVYLKLEDGDTTAFPAMPPNIKATIRGKRVFDPRTGLTAFTHNPALILADIISDPIDGLGDSAINQDQLIAAANICDEPVPCAAGLEARYACSIDYDTSAGVGDAMSLVLESMAGDCVQISGEWYIFPGAYLAPTLTFTEDDLIDRPTIKTARSYRNRFNRVRGKYMAPNYPYNVAGNAYDSNGFYNGQTQNNFPYEWQSTDFPEVAQDQLHGFAADQFLNEDGGVELVMQANYEGVLSVSQAQRLAFIALRRSRQERTGTLLFNVSAIQLQPRDTFFFNFPAMGFNNSILEVLGVDLMMQGGDNGQAPSFAVQITWQDTDPSVYGHNSAEELTPYEVPAVPTQASYTTAPPTGMTVTSNPITQPDGTTTHTLLVEWDTPADVRVTQILCQYQMQGSSAWIDGGTVSVQSNALLLTAIQNGQTYNVRLASLRTTGPTSAWVEADGVSTLYLSPVVYQGQGIDPGALSVAGTTVSITAINTALGNTPVSYYSGGASVALPAGTASGTPVYVYTVDPTFTGGSPAPIATTNRSDYLGKPGYVLVGQVTA